MDAICNLRDTLNEVLLYPIFLLIFAIGLLFFVWGIVEFLLAQNGVSLGNKSAEDSIKEGKKHMLWGIVGMFIIFSAYSLVSLIINLMGGTIVNCNAVVCPSGLPPGLNGQCPGGL